MSSEYVNRAFTPVMPPEEDYVVVDKPEKGHDQNNTRKSSSPNEDELRRKLKFFLANPCQRWCMEECYSTSFKPISNNTATTAATTVTGPTTSNYSNDTGAPAELSGYTDILMPYDVEKHFEYLNIARHVSSVIPIFQILFLTLNKAIHNILRYMLCCSIIYAGFVFCGWAVLGPYHLKFKSLQSTAECLFATINGDDLYGTLSNFTVAKDEFIWWFSRAFMFVYIAIFTAIAINLFIAILTDTYETIKQYCKHGFPMETEDDIYDN
ncbi:hypothetical protein KUTeg_021168 [Tegillarca granosa]|uniref:Ion transport domain-containing protein n=1 Tax=Tegillarca granosa TaxID=220873 RepID=A0ABQ9EA10_TEGGR|nr:hypothetical protein KUTeg_021168 [Tegillarca granosa]